MCITPGEISRRPIKTINIRSLLYLLMQNLRYLLVATLCLISMIYNEEHMASSDSANINIEIYYNQTKNRVHLKWNQDIPSNYWDASDTKIMTDRLNVKIATYKNEDNIPELENMEVTLVNCNLLNNDYQHNSGVLSIFVPNKSLE